jgi:septal ring factor EnvC (AmiA/AmiB activator)
MQFPVFGADGLEDSIGESSPSGVRTIPAAEADLPVVRVHDDNAVRLAEAEGRVRLLMNGITPAQLKAMDTVDSKKRQLAAWQAQAAALSNAVLSAKNAVSRAAASGNSQFSERSQTLKNLEAQLAECQQECDAAREELDAAKLHVANLQRISA